MIHYHTYEPVTPTTCSLNLYPGEPDKHPIVTLIVRKGKISDTLVSVLDPRIITIRKQRNDSYKALVPDLSEDSQQKALALIVTQALVVPCEQQEISIYFHDQPDRTKLN